MRPARCQSVQYRPSETEVREHELTHIPYRSWCEHCLRGKAQAGMHRSSKTNKEGDIPTVSIDYTFPGIDRLEEKTTDREIEEIENGAPVLVVYDDKTKALFANVVQKKGRDPFAIKRTVQDLRWLGHRRINLRSDQEPAIGALKDRVSMQLNSEFRQALGTLQ